MLGESIGSYQVTGKLSEGGMGVVYRAEHALLGRAAAIKLLLPALSKDREIVQRFFTEAKVTSSIRHPGIVEIFDFGYHADGRAYLIMELLAGESLARRLARGPIGEPATVAFARNIAGALAAAHARGVIHRDLKPDNIFLVPDPDVPAGERPKLLDFGIAKLADARRTTGATRTGMVLGTPAYMSPEQCRGSGVVDARADLYALGCIIYECVAGRPPFDCEGQGELIGAHLHVAPAPLRDHVPQVAPELDALVGRLLAKDPADRPATAVLLFEELARIASIGVARAGWPVLVPTPTPAPGMHASPVPTTLGGAAGAMPTRKPAAKRRGLRATVLAAVTLGCAVGGVMGAMHLRAGRSEGTTHAAATAPAPVVEPAPQPQPEPQPQLQPQPEPQPQPQPPLQAEPAPEPPPSTQVADDNDDNGGKKGTGKHGRDRHHPHDKDAPPAQTQPPTPPVTTDPSPLLITNLGDGASK